MNQETRLAKWSMEQAKAYYEGKLDVAKIKMLDKIGFPFEYYSVMAKLGGRDWETSPDFMFIKHRCKGVIHKIRWVRRCRGKARYPISKPKLCHHCYLRIFQTYNLEIPLYWRDTNIDKELKLERKKWKLKDCIQ